MSVRDKQVKKDRARKWDEAAVLSAYESLMDEIGTLLDLIPLSGCRLFLPQAKPLQTYFHLLKQMEGELLVQWRIYQERGLEALLARQQVWLNQELRAPNGFFETWNRFCGYLWELMADPARMIGNDPWESYLGVTLTDQRGLVGFEGWYRSETADTVLQSLCRLFDRLRRNHPHHQCLCFLNLQELGAGYRPDIAVPGKVTEDISGERPFAPLRSLMTTMMASTSWQQMSEVLRRFWQKNSGGNYSLYPAFIVQRDASGKPEMRGVYPERWIHFEDLVGLETNQRRLKDNIRRFLEGKPAAHMLLWGGRGTGKSSSVLALLDTFVESGLRLIEIQQQDLDLIPWLSEQLRPLKERFLLFCDDLSFGQEDVSYKHLKTILEGSVLKPADNLLFVATANRKDLVLRGGADERDPEQKQLIDEKRAVDDRFGLKLFFEVPVFQQLEQILVHYADRTGFAYEREALWLEFRRFALRNNHDQPAGRTVHQFISEWVAEQNGAVGQNKDRDGLG